LIEAFEAQAIAMFSYMTDLDTVEIDDSLTQTWEIEGESAAKLLSGLLTVPPSPCLCRA
jgi:SHS2 domain-containing protein